MYGTPFISRTGCEGSWMIKLHPFPVHKGVRHNPVIVIIIFSPWLSTSGNLMVNSLQRIVKSLMHLKIKASNVISIMMLQNQVIYAATESRNLFWSPKCGKGSAHNRCMVYKISRMLISAQPNFPNFCHSINVFISIIATSGEMLY